jgi:hypothetical protein
MRFSLMTFVNRRSVAALVVGVAAFIAVAITLIIVLWGWGYAPADFPEAAVDTPVARAVTTQTIAGRTLSHVTIVDPRLGTIGFAVSLPDPLPRAGLPVIIVLGALGTGAHAVNLIHNPGANAIVGYDYPRPPQHLGVGDLISLRAKVLLIPGQVTEVARYVLNQPWADPNRVTLAGFSLGAITAPSVEHVMISRGVNVRWTVLADGGAPIGAVIAGDQNVRPAWLREVAAMTAELLFRPLDPELHVSQLKGHFLLVSSAADTTIPRAASDRLAKLTPSPKQVIQLPGGHVGTVGVAKLALLNAAIGATRNWLCEEGAIDSTVHRCRSYLPSTR